MAVFCKKSGIGAKFTIPDFNSQLTWSNLVELSIFNFQFAPWSPRVGLMW